MSTCRPNWCQTPLRYPKAPYSERVALGDDVIPPTQAVSAKDGSQLRSVRVQKGQSTPHRPVSVRLICPDGNLFKPSRWLGTAQGNLPNVRVEPS
ncbi:uncharacterized protein EI90DRAFT_2293148 [Cantharellus anzutake]|uniref:uncharacterized protein n=1 Tax=Cantharellus anzutake TaxID=1750568 RepID=UPI00190730E3|nr:uncharacterized protein EI90DRAFT_2293148 [Cantharellus anzutake]KAF8339854.1 hypothetical protein EI90DRAFT_2293148 [Cantharellus anzutake]